MKATIYHHTPSRMAEKKVRKFQIKAGENVELREFSSSVGANVNWCNYFGKLFFSV